MIIFPYVTMPFNYIFLNCVVVTQFSIKDYFHTKYLTSHKSKVNLHYISILVKHE